VKKIAKFGDETDVLGQLKPFKRLFTRLVVVGAKVAAFNRCECVICDPILLSSNYDYKLINFRL